LEDVGHGGMKVEEVGDMTEVEVMTEMEVMTNIKNDVRKDMQDDSNVRKWIPFHFQRITRRRERGTGGVLYIR